MGYLTGEQKIICHMREGLGLFHVILKYTCEISMDVQEGRFTYTQRITFY